MPNTVLGKVACTPRGDYAAGTSYEILDIVGYGGGSYMALKNDPEGAPSNDGVNWMQLATQGEPGTSVASIQRTSGTGAPGTTDVYTMYDSAGGTIGTFTVYNGSNGDGNGDLMADGSVPMTGALNMGGNKVTNLGAPGADTDAVRKQDLDAVAAEVDGILDGTTPAHLAPATETKIGGVIIGEGLSVTEDGTVSADDQIPTGGTDGQILTKTSTGPAWQATPKPLQTAIVLPISGWSGASKSKTVTVPGVSDIESAQLITVTPAIASQDAYIAAGMRCTGQGANSLIFTCETPPASALRVFVVIQEVTG